MIAAIALAAAVQIQASEYALTVPAAIPAGVTTFAFENTGKEPHDVRFVRIAAGHTMDEFVAWHKAGGAIVTPGRYLLICTIAEQEGRHFELGMIYRFTVD